MRGMALAAALLIAGPVGAGDAYHLTAPGESETAFQLEPGPRMVFYKGGKPVGELSWETGTLDFKGAATPSAVQFFSGLKPYLDHYKRPRKNPTPAGRMEINQPKMHTQQH